MNIDFQFSKFLNPIKVLFLSLRKCRQVVNALDILILVHILFMKIEFYKSAFPIFKLLEHPHSGSNISSLFFYVLRSFNINERIFCIALDSASTNNKMVECNK